MVDDILFDALNKSVNLDNPFASMGQRNLIVLLEALALIEELAEELAEELVGQLFGPLIATKHRDAMRWKFALIHQFEPAATSSATSPAPSSAPSSAPPPAQSPAQSSTVSPAPSPSTSSTPSLATLPALPVTPLLPQLIAPAPKEKGKLHTCQQKQEHPEYHRCSRCSALF